VLIITSSTVGSGNVADKFTASAVPLINWEQALQDNLLSGMAPTGRVGRPDPTRSWTLHPLPRVSSESSPPRRQRLQLGFAWKRGRQDPSCGVSVTRSMRTKGALLIDGATAARSPHPPAPDGRNPCRLEANGQNLSMPPQLTLGGGCTPCQRPANGIRSPLPGPTAAPLNGRRQWPAHGQALATATVHSPKR
jgi:hypothetical protein